AIFPDLTGVTTTYKRTPTFSTIVQQSESGHEVRVALRSSVLYRWDLTISVLPDGTDASLARFGDLYHEILNFIIARHGKWEAFTYNDPKDSTAYTCRF